MFKKGGILDEFREVVLSETSDEIWAKQSDLALTYEEGLALGEFHDQPMIRAYLRYLKTAE